MDLASNSSASRFAADPRSDSDAPVGARRSGRPRVVLALIRHGVYAQPEGVMSAHLPHPLLPAGEQQATEVVDLLVSEARTRRLHVVPKVDASVLLRAWQTARTIARGLRRAFDRSFEVAEFADLTERSIGAAANLTIDEIAAAVAADPRNTPLPADWRRSSDLRLPFPGAESLVEAGKRVARHLERCAQELAAVDGPDCLKLVVGHGGSFRHAALELGLLEREQVGQLSMEHCSPVYLEYEAEGRWRHVGGAWKDRVALGTLD